MDQRILCSSEKQKEGSGLEAVLEGGPIVPVCQQLREGCRHKRQREREVRNETNSLFILFSMPEEDRNHLLN